MNIEGWEFLCPVVGSEASAVTAADVDDYYHMSTVHFILVKHLNNLHVMVMFYTILFYIILFCACCEGNHLIQVLTF